MTAFTSVPQALFLVAISQLLQLLLDTAAKWTHKNSASSNKKRDNLAKTIKLLQRCAAHSGDVTWADYMSAEFNNPESLLHQSHFDRRIKPMIKSKGRRGELFALHSQCENYVSAFAQLSGYAALPCV